MKINGLASTNFIAFQIFVIIIINFKIIKKIKNLHILILALMMPLAKFAKISTHNY